MGGANLEGANLSGAVLTGVDTAGAKMTGANLAGCLRSLVSDPASTAALNQRVLDNEAWCQTGGKTGKPAMLDGEDLRLLTTSIKGRRLPALSAKGACLVGLDLSGAELQGANFEAADLRGADLRGADLRGARFAGANLTKADLREAILTGLPLGPDRSSPAVLSNTAPVTSAEVSSA